LVKKAAKQLPATFNAPAESDFMSVATVVAVLAVGVYILCAWRGAHAREGCGRRSRPKRAGSSLGEDRQLDP